MEQVVVTGANGLIGSAFCSSIQHSHQVVTLDVSAPEHPVDITRRADVLAALESSTAEHVVHFAAFTNVSAAWEQTDDTTGPAYQVNVVGTQNLVDACNETGKHLIAISTAYVFDGEQSEQYTEDDLPNPIEWYGKTKALAEEYVQNTADNWTILRIDQPFRAEPFAKLDLAHKIASELASDTLLPQFTDHYFGPTWIDDFVTTIQWVMRTNKSGLYHASNGERWTNYQFAIAVAQLLGKEDMVKPGSLAEYLKTSNRPYQKNTSLNCHKLFSEIDFTYSTVADALRKVKFSR